MAENNFSALVQLIVDKAQARSALQRELKELQKEAQLETDVKVNLSDVRQARKEIAQANREQQEGTRENIKLRAQELAHTRMLVKETKANADLESAQSRQVLLQTKARNKETIEGLKQERLLLQENRKLVDEKNKKSSTQKNLDKIQLSFDNGHGDSEYKNRIQSLVNDFERYGLSVEEANKKTANLRTILDGFKVDGNFLPDDQLIAQADKLEAEFKAVKVSLDSAKLSYDKFLQPVSSEKASSLIVRINSFLTKNTAITAEAKAELEGFVRQINSGINLSDWNKFNLRLKEIENDMRVAGKLGKTLKQTLVDGAKSFAQWTLSSASVMEVVQAIKTTVKNVKELDNSLLELDKVSDLTAEGLEKVTDKAYKLGDTVGKTGRQVIDATTEFKRAGYDLQQSMDMAEAALVMTNVAEGITETSDAAGTLISVLKGFKMSDTEIMSVVDKMNQVSNTSPIGFDELADGLERVSGTMNQAGNTIDQTLGLLTGGYAQLRNIEKVSSGMIFIQQRLRGIDEDGNAIEGLSAKLKESFAEIGVNVENADGSLRSMYQIATDYAKVLPTLTSKQKQYYGELAAGNRQITVWNAITEQIADVKHATTQAMDSIGSASEENQKYLDSISGKMSKFESAVEDLSYSVLDSDLVKFFVDLGTLGVKAIDGLVDSLTPLGILLAGGSVFAGFKSVDYLKMPVCPHHI